ncbi:MAG TPA: lipoate--protein ligase [Bacillales bacterium]|nr:lipoate--protein ligase [Bacillales bacterium]
MLYVNNDNILDPAVNLGIEEYILRKLDPNETYLMFYSMEPSVIVGKNQNTMEEINTAFVRENAVNVVRRLSGGGAVYNDEGDLSFSFITKDDGNSFHNYEKFTEPVIRALNQLGVNAKLSGRNDIEVDGKKVSGNAQFSTKGRIFSHGTLLFDVNLDHVQEALTPNPEKIESKGVKSVRSRVTNIREHLDKDMDIHEFRRTLLKFIFEVDDVKEVPEYKLTDEDWHEIHEIIATRYKNWDWNFSKSPKFNVKHTERFPAGTIDVRLHVNKGVIEDATLFGDFFGVGDVKDIETRLTGTRYEAAELEKALSDLEIGHYLGNITKEEFLNVLL